MINRRPGHSAMELAQKERRNHPINSLAARLLRVETAEQRWSKGAKGERFVGKRLDRLARDRWSVLHDLPLGTSGWNVDHLVIGPGGVFTINSKWLTGKVVVKRSGVYVDGHRTDYLPVARNEAKQVSERLTGSSGVDVKAYPLIAIVAEEMRLAENPADVGVQRGARIADWLMDLPDLLPWDAVARIWKAATSEESWTYDLERQVRKEPKFSRTGKFLHPSPVAETSGVDDVEIVEWKRFGHHRLYIKRAGKDLGFYDVRTGTPHAEDDAELAEIARRSETFLAQ